MPSQHYISFGIERERDIIYKTMRRGRGREEREGGRQKERENETEPSHLG